MKKIHINKNQFSDLINLINGVFFPLKNFVSKEEFIKIIDNKKFKKHFYPFPIFFGVSKEVYLKSKESISLDLYFKKKYLLNISNIDYYDLKKKKNL